MGLTTVQRDCAACEDMWSVYDTSSNTLIPVPNIRPSTQQSMSQSQSTVMTQCRNQKITTAD